MSYQRTIQYLYGLQKYGMKFGLDNIGKLLSAAGNPQDSFRSVHVGGTNGKGSTSAMIESILRTGGVTTGLFTSPHLVSFTERIRINGVEISEADVIGLADEVRSFAEKFEDFCPTFFEVVTTMAFLHFRRMKVDWAVVEVGLGGRLDATNIIMPEVSVIASIGFDHLEFLGNSLSDIAREKAGIIKEGVPVVTAVQQPAALDVIERRAEEAGCRLFRYGSDFSARIEARPDGGVDFHYRGVSDHERLSLPLKGDYQIVNASLALRTMEIITGKYPELGCDFREGLAAVKWPGRLEMVKSSPAVLIDGAHNPDAAKALSAHLGRLQESEFKRFILVLGIMGDKDIDGIMKPLLPLASEIIFTAAAYGRAASPELLANRAASMDRGSRAVPSVAEALALAEELALPGDLIVVTGSFYTIGEAKELIMGKGVLSRLRE